jgi:hypothetical protein
MATPPEGMVLPNYYQRYQQEQGTPDHPGLEPGRAAPADTPALFSYRRNDLNTPLPYGSGARARQERVKDWTD